MVAPLHEYDKYLVACGEDIYYFYNRMNKKFLKIFLIFFSVVYLLAFLEVDENERNQSYKNEYHSYLAASSESITAKIISGSISKCFSPVMIPQGIDELTLTFKLSFTNKYFARLNYPTNRIYLQNSILLI